MLHRALLLASLTATTIASATPSATSAAALDIASFDQRIRADRQGWASTTELDLLGTPSSPDPVRIAWRQRDTVVALETCTTTRSPGGIVHASCRSDRPLQLDGWFRVDVIHGARRVATLATEIRTWTDLDGARAWGAYRDDLLNLAWARADSSGDLSLYFWSSNDHLDERAFLICDVDGKDHRGRVTLRREQLHRVNRYAGDSELSHYWARYKLKMALALEPGAWSCTLLVYHGDVRHFRFVVDSTGAIQPNELQRNLPPALGVSPRVTLVDSTIAPRNQERRIRPDALRRSLVHGLAWPAGVTRPPLPAAVGAD